MYREDFKRVKPPGRTDDTAASDGADEDLDDAFEDEDENEEDEDYDDETLWWPRNAKHSPQDFKKFFNCPRSSMLRYTFSSRGKQQVPDSEPPYFHGDW